MKPRVEEQARGRVARIQDSPFNVGGSLPSAPPATLALKTVDVAVCLSDGGNHR